MKSRYQNILVNVIGIITFLILPVFFSPGPQLNFDNIFNHFAMSKWVSRGIMVVVFYLHYFYFIDKLYFTKRYILYGLVVLVGFAFTIYVPRLLVEERNPQTFKEELPIHHSPPPKPDGEFRFKPPHQPENSIFAKIGHDIYLYLIVVFGALMIKIRVQWEQTREEKLSAEINYLRSQINPHFIFNSLNNIYALAIEKSDATADAVVKLSSIMRYVMAEANKEMVSLEREIEYIRNYIDLQKLRFGDDIQIIFNAVGAFHTKKIAPLLLISFIENAFKYGVNAEEETEIKIDISLIDSEFTMKVYNKIVLNHLSEEQKNGIGLENTINRLKLIYGEDHFLRIEHNENNFFVNLKILL